jgi:uncharacterized protein
MRITLTGATGRIGQSLVAALRERGDDVTILSRSGKPGTVQWDPKSGPAPAEALDGRDAVIHLAGEDVGQRWSDSVKREIRDSREQGTRNLVAGIRAAEPRPAVLVSASASGYYGPHGSEPVDESAPPADDFLGEVVQVWEREALAAEDAGLRVVLLRTGVVLDKQGGALSKMLPPFKAGVGGPVAGGEQYLPWIHRDDVVGLYLAAVDGGDAWSGPINVSAPAPVTNRDFSKALGKALKRPAVFPVPSFGIKILYGEMSTIVTNGVNMVPARATDLGYRFRHPEVGEALRSALGR